MRIDSVRIGAADLEAECAAYTLLLGVAPVPRPDGARRFALARGAAELEAGEPGLRGLRLVAGAAEGIVPPASFHGIAVRIDPPGDEPAGVAGAVEAIDHVVARTADAERAIALWRDRLGLRLALDRTFPERGLRLLFFRSGGVTLEYASPHPPLAGAAGPDRLHGVSYRVTDLAVHRARLLAAGVDVSPIRPGMRPGTTVATVRSGTAGVPTLLLELR